MAYFDYQLQRKQEIEETLLELMQDMPYDQISVKSLTEKIQIARKTYYHYFPNKQACLESLMDRLILDYNLSQLRVPENADLQEVYSWRLTFWIGHRDFLEAILRNNLAPLLVERILRYIYREDRNLQCLLNTRELACDEDVLYFYISGQIYLMLKWCSEGFSLSLEEMVQKCLRLTHEPMLTQKKI